MISNLDSSTADRPPLRRRRYLKITIRRIETGKPFLDARWGMGCDPDLPQGGNPPGIVSATRCSAGRKGASLFCVSRLMRPRWAIAANCRLIGVGPVKNASKSFLADWPVAQRSPWATGSSRTVFRWHGSTRRRFASRAGCRRGVWTPFR